MSDSEESVELRRREPSPIPTLIPARKQSHLPSISEIHHLRLSLNEKLMHHGVGAASGKQQQHRAKQPFVTAPSSPLLSSAARKLVAVSSPPPSMTNNSAPAEEQYNDLHMFLIREHYTSQKSFVHSNHANEMRRVQDLREVKQQLVACQRQQKDGGCPGTKEASQTTSSAFFKRNSFLRNSWNVILRQSIRLSSSNARSSWESGGSGEGGSGGSKRKGRTDCERAVESATTVVAGNGVPGTPTNSKCSSDSEFLGNRFSFQSLRRKKDNGPGERRKEKGHKRNSSTSSFFSNR